MVVKKIYGVILAITLTGIIGYVLYYFFGISGIVILFVLALQMAESNYDDAHSSEITFNASDRNLTGKIIKFLHTTMCLIFVLPFVVGLGYCGLLLLERILNLLYSLSNLLA